MFTALIESLMNLSIITTTLIALAAIVGITLIAAMMWRTVVPQDEVHIVNSSKHQRAYGDQKAVGDMLEGQTDKNKISESHGNVYYRFPSWIPLLGVVLKKLPLNVFQVNLDDFPSYDQDKVPFEVDFKSWFVISNPLVAAKRVKAIDELERQLEQMLQGIVRKTMAGKTIKEIMESRSELKEIFMTEVGEQCKDWGVKLNSIEFTDIRDLEGGEFTVIDDIQRVFSSGIQKDRRVAESKNEKEARLAEIQNKREADLEDVIAKEQVETRNADKTKIVGIANEKAQQEIKEQAKVTKNKEIAVEREQEVGKATYQKEVVIVEANAKKEFAIIEAEATQKSRQIEAEGTKQAAILEGEGNASKTEKEGTAEAKVIEAKATAEAVGVEKMAHAKKQLQEAMKVELGALLIQAQKEVGIENAKALGSADIRMLISDGKDNLATKIEGLFQNSDVFKGMLKKFGLEGYMGNQEGKGMMKDVVDGLVDDATKADKPSKPTKPSKATETEDDEEA